MKSLVAVVWLLKFRQLRGWDTGVQQSEALGVFKNNHGNGFFEETYATSQTSREYRETKSSPPSSLEVGDENWYETGGGSPDYLGQPERDTPWLKGRQPATSLAEYPSCPALSVDHWSIAHPKVGAVYWEGPVAVDLQVTLVGPGLQGLDLRSIHICAETEDSWPMGDHFRSCMPFQELASPDGLSLYFGSAIGVITGFVTLWDARPTCISPGTPRGHVLPMVNPRDGVASKSVRFKVIHHESTILRLGRPLGSRPFGRGLATVEELLQDLEWDADQEMSTAVEVMRSYRNLSHGSMVNLTRKYCGTRLDVHSRGTSLLASGFQVGFIIEQLDWMLDSGKLPPEFTFAIDRMRELQGHLPDDSTADFFTWKLLEDSWWRSVAPFFQKALSIPAPAQDRIVSSSPLHTWEYDDIPWMEALNPEVDWRAMEDAYLGNTPIELVYIDSFFSPKALAVLRDLALGSTIYFDAKVNYLGAYPSDGLSHPLLYQIAEEAAERMPRIVGRGTTGWPLAQTWIYIYGGNDEERCVRGIKIHADTAVVNMNVWLTPDSANLGSPDTDDDGGLTVYHAKPPADWTFSDFNTDSRNPAAFIEASGAGSTSVPYRQNRALIFDSMLFHKSDPFRFKTGFENRRINLTLLFGKRPTPSTNPQRFGPSTESGPAAAWTEGGIGHVQEHPRGVMNEQTVEVREVSPEESGRARYCL